MNRLFESSLLNHVAASSLRFDYTPLLTAKAQPEQKDLVVKGMKANMAANAVKITGLARRTTASTMESSGDMPAAKLSETCWVKINVLRIRIPANPIRPSKATNPNGEGNSKPAPHPTRNGI